MRAPAAKGKAELSFSSWILGGSLTQNVGTARRSSGKRIMVMGADAELKDKEKKPSPGEQKPEKKEEPSEKTEEKPKEEICKKDAKRKKHAAKHAIAESEGDKSEGEMEWTKKKDKTIKKMKGAGKTWAEIAAAVGSDKHAVRQRFHFLEQSEDEGKSDAATDGGNSDAETSGGKKDKGKKHKHMHDDNSNANEHQSHGNSGNERKYRGQLKPDAVWSVEDIEVLDMLEKRYTEHKWLHIQAAFYNWTGRMVIAELIEKKFRDDGAI